MRIVLPALAVAFAAFCVWLTVRIISRRESWATWTLAVVILYTAYFAAVYHATGGAPRLLFGGHSVEIESR